jgi:hypothetical protein
MINTTLGENVKGTSLTTSLLYCEKLTMPLEKFDLTDIEKFFWLEKHSHGFPTRKHRRCLHNATEGPTIFSFLLFSKTFFYYFRRHFFFNDRWLIWSLNLVLPFFAPFHCLLGTIFLACFLCNLQCFCFCYYFFSYQSFLFGFLSIHKL